MPSENQAWFQDSHVGWVIGYALKEYAGSYIQHICIYFLFLLCIYIYVCTVYSMLYMFIIYFGRISDIMASGSSSWLFLGCRHCTLQPPSRHRNSIFQNPQNRWLFGFKGLVNIFCVAPMRVPRKTQLDFPSNFFFFLCYLGSKKNVNIYITGFSNFSITSTNWEQVFFVGTPTKGSYGLFGGVCTSFFEMDPEERCLKLPEKSVDL